MKTLLIKTKITKSTFKSFIKRNQNDLYVRINSHFDGMCDCIMPRDDNYRKVDPSKINLTVEKDKYGFTKRNHDFGIDGLWLVEGGRDYFTLIDNDECFGVHVFNSCGSSDIVIKK